MASERHATKKLTLPGIRKVMHIDEKLLIGIQRLNELGFTPLSSRVCDEQLRGSTWQQERMVRPSRH